MATERCSSAQADSADVADVSPSNGATFVRTQHISSDDVRQTHPRRQHSINIWVGRNCVNRLQWQSQYTFYPSCPRDDEIFRLIRVATKQNNSVSRQKYYPALRSQKLTKLLLHRAEIARRWANAIGSTVARKHGHPEGSRSAQNAPSRSKALLGVQALLLQSCARSARATRTEGQQGRLGPQA